MTATRLWDRAAVVPAPADGRRRPAVAALPRVLPTVAELFEFMRDAELRFETLRMRIEERSRTARGEEAVAPGLAVRAIPATPRSRRRRDRRRRRRRVRDLDLRRRDRPDLRERPRLGTQRPDPQPPARSRRSGLPGLVEGLRAGDRAADGDAARHLRPPGWLLPERARDRALPGQRDGDRRRARGDPARMRPPAHDRARRRSARTSTSRSRSTARPG